jgi:cytochrome c biogenesis protein CcmG, thiol:disulfide interchange protein DsbE
MMTNKRTTWYRSELFVLLVLLFCLVPDTGISGPLYEDGAKPADFSLENILDGKTVSLSKCDSKLLILEFGSRYCKPCREMVPDLVKLYENYKSAGVMIFKIDIDSEPDKQAMKSLAAETKMTFPYLVGNREIASQYGVQMLPTIYLIDKNKKVVKKYKGYQPYEVLERDFKVLK